MFRFTKALIALSLSLGVLSLASVFEVQDASAQGLRPNPTPPKNGNGNKNNTPPTNVKNGNGNNNTPPANNNNNNLNNIFQKNSGVQTFSPKGYLGGGTLPPILLPTQPQYSSPFFNPNMYQQNPYQNQNQNFRPYNNFNNFNSNLNPFGLPFGANQFQNFNNFQNANNFNNLNNPFNNVWNNNQVFFPNNLPQQQFNFGVPGPQFNFQIPPVGQPLPQMPGNFNPFAS